MRINATALTAAAIAAAILSAGAARADESPLGVWIDHTGRGAVEIKDCSGKLCGYVAWVKDPKDAQGCGEQIIGDVKSVGSGTWDNGWIYDPDRDDKFDVEIKPTGPDTLRVTGYAGMKWLSETMTWKRAPADLQMCSKTGSTEAKAAPAERTKDAAEAKPATNTDAKAEAKAEAMVDANKEAKVELNADTKAPESELDKQAAAPDRDKADEPKGKSADKGKAAAKIAEALNFRKSKGGGCKIDVPYLDAVVSFPCDE